MPATTLTVAGLLTLASALLYASVGALMLRRPASDADTRLALSLFGVWWIGLAVSSGVGAARSLLAAADVTDLNLHWALSIVSLVAVVVALWGLVYYLLFVYLGKRWILAPVTVFHAALLVWFLWLTLALEPTAVKVNTWNVGMDYARPASAGVSTAALVLILAPALVAAFGYGSLFFQTDDRTARYRVAMVAGAFLLWFGSSAIATPIGWTTWYWWPLVAQVIALLATLMVLAAYVPPRFLARAFGLRSVTDSAPVDGDKPRGPRRALPTAIIFAAARRSCA